MSKSNENDFNVCGVLVRALTVNHVKVERALEDLPGVEVHGCSEDGDLVVTVEDTNQSFASESLLAINRVDGVLSASLVYHHCEPLAEI